MADDIQLNAGSGGSTVRTLEDSSNIQWPAGVLAYATTVGTPDVLQIVTPTTGLPVQSQTGATWTVTGTVALSAGAAVIGAVTQSGTWNLNNISGTISLPTGAATAAKQPALGTAGTASSDVITVQGIASMTALKVDGSAVTQPVSLASVIPGTGATNLGKAEDAAHASGDTGVMFLGVRRDANSSLVDTTGDYAPCQFDAIGGLKVSIISGAGSGGTALADNAAFTPGTTSFTPIGGEVDDTATTDATENSAAVVRMTAKRAIHVNLRDNTGAELSVGGGTQYDEDTVATDAEKLTMAGVVRRDVAATGAGTDGDRTELSVGSDGRLWASATVTNSVTVANAGVFAVQASIGSGSTEIGKTEDNGSADGDVGVPAMAIRKATPVNTSDSNGDYEMLQMSVGRLWTSATIDAALPTGSNVIGAVTQSGTWNVATVTTVSSVSAVIAGTGATNLGKAEDAAHASGDTGVFILGVRNNALGTTFTSANGDYSPIAVNPQGAVFNDPVKVATASAPSQVSSSASSVTLLASNANRVMASVFNDSTQVLYLKFGSTASSSSYTIKMAAGAYAELPATLYGTGIITGIWASANGSALVGEFTNP